MASPSVFEVQDIISASVSSNADYCHSTQIATLAQNITPRGPDDELWHRNEYRFDERLQRVDDMLRNEELRYAKFMAKRNNIIGAVSDFEYKQLVSSVSLRLVYYDPNFDFQSRRDSLWDYLNQLQDPCNHSKQSRLEVRHLNQTKGL